MKLSIVTVNRNNAAGLARTLASTFRSQPGFDDWEQIVVDGASTDGSFDALAPYRDDPHLGWHVSEPDTGIYNAMNQGAAHARGDFLLFLNSGDELVPDSLEKVFAKPVDADILYGREVQTDGQKETPYPFVPASRLESAWFLFRSLPHQASCISRALFELRGGYDESFRIVSDAKFFLECVRDGTVRFRDSDVLVARFRTDGVSKSFASRSLHFDERERMLAPVFGPDIAHWSTHPSEGRRWIKSDVAEAAKRDAAFADCLRRTSTAVYRLWRFAPTRWLLKAVRGAASAVKRIVRHA